MTEPNSVGSSDIAVAVVVVAVGCVLLAMCTEPRGSGDVESAAATARATPEPPRPRPAPTMEITSPPSAAVAQPVAEGRPSPDGPITLGKIRSFYARCPDDGQSTPVNGRPRLMCQYNDATPVLFEAIGGINDLDKATLAVGLPNDVGPLVLLKAMTHGFEFFSAIAGKPVGDIAPKSWVKNLAKREQSFSRDGVRYTTTPMLSISMLFFVAERGEATARRKKAR